MKKLLTRFVLFVALIQPVIASAILPLVAGGLVMATNSTSLATALFGSTLVVGAAVGFVALGSNTTPAAAPVLVHINAAEPLPTPSGWTAPVSPSIEPKAPNVSQYECPAGHTCNDSTANSTNACSWPLGEIHVTPGNVAYKRIATFPESGWAHQLNCGGAYVYAKSAYLAQCPSGYTASGGVCVATVGAVTKPSDSKCTIIRTGNTFAADPNDPDCSAGVGTDVTISGTEIEARPSNQKQKVKINGDGSVTTTTTTINTTNNTTTTTTINVSNGSGVGNTKITGIGTTTVSGTGDQAGTTPIPNSGEDGKATEATLSAAKAKLDQIKDGQCGGTGQPSCKIDETGTPTESTLGDAKTDVDSKYSAHTDAIAGVTNKTGADLGFGLSITWPSGSCTNPTFALPKAGSLTIDFCGKRAPIIAALEWLVLFCTIWMIVNIGFNAVERKG